MDKGDTKDDLVALRRLICERFIREPGYRFVELPDPPRARTVADSPAYRQAVADWHARAGAACGPMRSRPNSSPVASARFWRGVTRRSTTARCGSWTRVAAHVDIDYDVIPGITAIQALTARHRIPLNDIGEPVLITTGRQLRENGLSGSAVVMLDADCSFQDCPPSTRIWWGAYLGTPDEIAGLRAPSVRSGHDIAELRAPKPVPSTAGSWTPTCCVRQTERMGSFLLRAALTGFALWVVTLIVPGISFVGGDSTLQEVGIIFVVGVIFGLVNAIIKPIVQFISIPLYILTLGLIHIVINALMLWITSWITENTTHWGLVHRRLLVDGDLGRDRAVDRELAACRSMVGAAERSRSRG